MATVENLRAGKIGDILVSIAVGGLGLYFGLVLADAIGTTVRAILPNQNSPLADVWITVGVSFLVIAIIIALLVFILQFTQK